MNEYESAALFLEYLNTGIQLVLAYVSILSAFLVMSYFAADKLHSWLLAIVLVLFTLVCLLIITQLSFVRNEFGQFYQYLLAQKAAGHLNLPWLGTNPAWGIRVLTVLHISVTIGGYIGCIAFFLNQRRQATHQ